MRESSLSRGRKRWQSGRCDLERGFLIRKAIDEQTAVRSPAEVDVDVGVLCVRDDGHSDDARLDTEQTDETGRHQLQRGELGHADTCRRVDHDGDVCLTLAACTTVNRRTSSVHINTPFNARLSEVVG